MKKTCLIKKIKDLISMIITYILIGFMILFCGIMLSPLWFIFVIIGALLQAFEWKEAPIIFWDMVTCKWL